jgi:hypothetical protein
VLLEHLSMRWTVAQCLQVRVVLDSERDGEPIGGSISIAGESRSPFSWLVGSRQSTGRKHNVRRSATDLRASEGS